LASPASNGHRQTVDLGALRNGTLPLLPQFTPHTRRRRVLPADLFSPDNIPLLLPNHAVSGSGRRTPGVNALKAPFLLGHDELARLNENLAFEEDALSDGSDGELGFGRFAYDSIIDSPSKKPRRTASVPLPLTPRKQVITDKQVHEWHGHSSRLKCLYDDDWDAAWSCTPLSNPFLSTSSVKHTHPSRPSTINYDTHMELINHRTGERKVVPLLLAQRRHKPRRIDFSAM
ncbi:hypothetical protein METBISCDRAFT_28873, partial [Metschnikowia bicuspidata]